MLLQDLLNWSATLFILGAVMVGIAFLIHNKTAVMIIGILGLIICASGVGLYAYAGDRYYNQYGCPRVYRPKTVLVQKGWL